MFDPFVGRRTLTPEQWKARGEAIQARLQGLSIDELLRGGRGAGDPDVGAHGQRRGGYDPNQPRVPAGNSDGGQWTDDAWWSDGEQWTHHPLVGVRFAASRELPPIGPLGGRIPLILRRALGAIEKLRSRELLNDLLGHRRGSISMLDIDGEKLFGSNSGLPLYTSEDRAAADDLREKLLSKYPEFERDNTGQWPMDAVYHSETNVLLRAARKLKTLAGRKLEVVTDRRMCPSCLRILPKVGLELGNPTVTFVGPRGESRTMRDGMWTDLRGHE